MVVKDFSYLVIQNKFQKGYLEHVFGTRNVHKENAMTVKLNEVWINSDVDETLVEMVYHALHALNATNKMMKDNTLEFDSVKIEGIDEMNPIETSLKLYEEVINETEEILKEVDLDQISGTLNKLQGNEEAFIRRYGILTMHAVHHWGQIIRFHGIICNILEKE